MAKERKCEVTSHKLNTESAIRQKNYPKKIPPLLSPPLLMAMMMMMMRICKIFTPPKNKRF
jgi:hypothetical protein